MKKILIIIILNLLFIPKIVNALEINLNAKSAILIEESTGKIIYEKNADERLNPASMTKIMSLIIIMENIENKNISYTDEVLVSKNASSMGGSQVYINTGEKYTVEELIKGVAIASANDAVVALAEKVGGTEENFVKMMNDKALSLGLKNTNFVNPHGLDEENHYSTARDMSVMAKELLKYKDILNFTSKYEDYFKKKDGSSIWLVNTNKLVKFYEGMDGLKTGYTEKAGYCLTATASKNNLRFISVVMGEDSIENRTEDTLNLMNYGFNTTKKEILMSSNKIIEKKYFPLSNKGKYNIYLKEDAVNISSIEDKNSNFTYKIKYNKNLSLPIKKNSKVGYIEFKINDNLIKKDLIIKENINKISLFKQYKNNLSIVFSGLI